MSSRNPISSDDSGSRNSSSRRSGAEPSRRSYQPIASLEGAEDPEELSPSAVPSAPSLAVRPGRRHRRPYQTVASQDEDDDDETADAISVASVSSKSSSSSKKAKTKTLADLNIPAPSMTLILLDGHQTKFKIPAHPDWTTAQFKAAGSLIHKVPVSGQRIVFRGKLLADDQTLGEAGINTENTIVHLFPKPRVVLEGDGSGQQQEQPTCSDNDSSSTGAHVPTIVLNADEAERRSQILVLGSVEYTEAQSNVKLFSFMLMMISTMELLNLLAIFMGVPQEEQNGSNLPSMMADDVFVNLDDDMYANHGSSDDGGHNASTNSSSTGYDGTDPYLPLEQNPWGWVNMVDLFLSLLGVYVALVGIRAASETRLALARVYLTGTIIVGVGWMLFNYYLTVRMDEAMQDEQVREYEANHPDNGTGSNHHHQHNNAAADDDNLVIMSDEDIYKSALSVMVLPGLVWFMCCLRAAQFHNLLHEAELEASTRIQAQMQLTEHDEENDDSDGRGSAEGRGSNLPGIV